MALPSSHPVPQQSCHILPDSLRFHLTHGHRSPSRSHWLPLMNLLRGRRHTSEQIRWRLTAQHSLPHWPTTVQSPCQFPPGSQKRRGYTPCSPHRVQGLPTMTDGQTGRQSQRNLSNPPGRAQTPAWLSRIFSREESFTKLKSQRSVVLRQHSADIFLESLQCFFSCRIEFIPCRIQACR